MEAQATRTSLEEALTRALARGTSDLPTLPRGAADALRLARRCELDFTEVEAASGKYPPLAARLLSVGNSALYRRPGVPRIASVRRATARLGTQATRDVLYQVAYATLFVEVPRYRDLIEATFRAGVEAAEIARFVAAEADLDPDMSFLAGLLYDVGRARCWKLVAGIDRNASTTDAEAAVDLLHARAGAELVAAWQLPEEVVEACRWHHAPKGLRYATLAASCDALSRVRSANEPVAAEARDHLGSLGLSADRAEAMVARAVTRGWSDEPAPSKQ